MFKFINGTVLAFCFSLPAFITGCSYTATITRIDAPDLEAEIGSSDSRNINVKTDSDTISIPRSTVTSIDHPGNVAATIGAIVTAYGIANIAVGASNCERNGAAYCTGVFLPAGIGIPLMTWGFRTWLMSTIAAKAPTENIAIVPTISVDKKNEYVGVSAAMRF